MKSKSRGRPADLNDRRFVGTAAMIAAVAELAIAHAIGPQFGGMRMVPAVAKAPRPVRGLDRF
jgi:hypothetical protein